eukprot:COSAG06_NODE_3827_length_4861_cov_61.488450_8_plen_161_part_00
MLGQGHPKTLAARGNLAVTLEELGEVRRAEEEYQAVLEAKIVQLGSDHAATLTSMWNLGALPVLRIALPDRLALLSSFLPCYRRCCMLPLCLCVCADTLRLRMLRVCGCAIALLKKEELGDLEGGLALLREAVEAARRNPDVRAEDREQYAEELQQWEAL